MNSISLVAGSTVLIVDDIPALIAPIADALEEVGFKVLVAEDGREAIHRARLARPELILLDVMMPEMDGLQVCRQLKQLTETADIPVIFMTGMTDTTETLNGFEAGAVDFLIKPLRIDETIARISTHVRVRRMQQRLESQNEELMRYREHLEELVSARTAMLDESNRRLRTEIEERQIANRELQVKESLLRSLIDSIPDLIYFKNTESIFLGVNKACEEFCGMSEAELVGKTDHAYAPRALAELFRERDRMALESGVARRDEEEVVYPDGRRILLDTVKTPLRDTEGRIIGVIGVSRDITERKEMEEELARREQEYRTLAENSPDSLVRYDRDFRRIYFNEAYLSFSLLPAERLLGKTPEECWWTLSPTAEEYTEMLARVFRTGQREEVSSEFIGEDGRVHYGNVYLVPEFDREGRVVSVLSIGHDISALKATERSLEGSRRQLRALTARLERAREQERKRIAREIHDELGQLLSVLRLNVTTLDYRFGADNPELKSKTDSMVVTVDRTIAMVRNLASELRPAVLGAGLASALEWLVHEFAENTGLSFDFDVSGDEILLDEGRSMLVFRIVQECLTNILRHARADRFQVSISCLHSKCNVMVRDNGQGFDVSRIENMSSLGLLGMRERSLMLGGTLDVESIRDQGTTVSLAIPLSTQPLPFT